MNGDPVLLALETSGKSGSVSVIRESDGRIVCDSEMLSPDSGSARTLAPAIEGLLSRNNIEMESLNAIALLTGPGSFTGLRVGIATAKAIAYAIKVPTIEIDTLDVIAKQCTVASESVYAVLDAYRGQIFCAEYSIQGMGSANQFRKVSKTEIVDIDVFLDRVERRADGGKGIDICGPGCDRIQKFLADIENGQNEIASARAERIRWIDGPLTFPRAETVAQLGLAKYLAGDVLDPFSLLPHYYRASAAEEAKK